MDPPTYLTGPIPNDTDIPSNIDPSQISFVCEFLPVTLASFIFNPRTTDDSWDYGEGIYISPLADDFQAGQGWMIAETILLQFDTRYTPSGHFPVYSNETGYGYDAAVCVQEYEPWVIETYNTSIAPPSALRIIERGNCNGSLPPSGNIHGARISNTRCLNSTGKGVPFSLALYNTDRMTLGFTELGPSPIVGPAVTP